MKHKYLGIVIAMLLLTGCGAEEKPSDGGSTTAQTAVTTTAVTTVSETTTAAAALQTAASTTSISASAVSTVGTAVAAAAKTTAKFAVSTEPSAAENGAPVPKNQSADMEQAAAEFMDAVIAKDKARAAEILRVKEYKNVMKDTGSDEELLDQIAGDLNEAKVKSYKIKNCTRAGVESLLHISEMLVQYKQDAQQENDSERLADLERLETFFNGITDAAVVNVEVTLTDDAEGTADNELPVTVICYNGKWRADMLSAMVVSTIEWAERMQDVGAKTAAKSVYISLSTALTDLDVENADISVFNGKTIAWTSKDFENVKKITEPSGFAQMKEALRWKMKQYFNDITKLDEIRIMFDAKGRYALAVKQKGKIGTYPAVSDKQYTELDAAVQDALAQHTK